MKRIVRTKRRRRGMALLYSLMASFAVATMVTGMFSMAFSSKDITDVKVRGGQARYMAEGAVEIAKNAVQSAIANWQNPVSGTATINGQAIPYTVTATGLNTITTDPAGIQTLVTGYALEATVTQNGHTYTAHRLVNAQATPVFQFAVFYTNDLEINPGPNMMLGGRVHSNKNMYLNCGGTLACNTNYVRAVGSIFRNRKDQPNLSEGTVKIRNWVQNPFSGTEPTSWTTMNSIAQMSSLGISTTSGYDANFDTNYDMNADGDFDDAGDWLKWSLGALSLWAPPSGYTTAYGNTVMDSAHGVTEAETPYIGSIKMFEPVAGGNYAWDPVSASYQPVPAGTGSHNKGYYHSQAGLSIITNATNSTWKAYDKNGNDITTAVAATGAVTLGSIYDARQAGSSSTKVKVTKIDVAKLNTSGYFPTNGLVYAAGYGAGTGTNAKGVQLVNGSFLSNKLTVVTENSVYIQGDYNTSNKKGAAVIADAVNLLSNAWTGTKTSSSGLPTASNTTFNVAMISGNQDTVTNVSYNGGLENLPRFHENWTDKNCTIKGSFVNTWLSQYATGQWVYGSNKYTAPNRVWSYDTAFNTVANLPPYTPMAVTMVDAAVW